MESLEDRIGYHFAKPELLQEALTHPSLAYESKEKEYDNQRLEFLGDAVLQLILTSNLYLRFPDFSEGRLTKLRSRLVSRDALCRYAAKLDLGPFLRLGKGETASGGRERPSNLADAIEALIGAVYLDGGFEPARDLVIRNFGEFIDEISQRPDEDNPKGELQENLQAISSSSPTYEIVDQEGPDHQKLFVAEVSWEGILLGKGSGSSKKEAEINAAAEALEETRWTERENP